MPIEVDDRTIQDGRYDDWCTHVREGAQARSTIIVVLGGERGNGCSIQGVANDMPQLAAILRAFADHIDSEFERRRQELLGVMGG